VTFPTPTPTATAVAEPLELKKGSACQAQYKGAWHAAHVEAVLKNGKVKVLIPKPYQKLTVDASALIARSEGQFAKGDLVHAEFKGAWRDATVQKTVKQAAGTAFEVKILKPYKVTLLPAYKIRFRKGKTTITTTTTVSGGNKTVTTTVQAQRTCGESRCATSSLSTSTSSRCCCCGLVRSGCRDQPPKLCGSHIPCASCGSIPATCGGRSCYTGGGS